MAKYIVTVPFRGEQYYEVEAASAAEAMRKADQGFGDDVEPLDFRPTRTYKPSEAKLETPATVKRHD